jgi:hypothetical protein
MDGLHQVDICLLAYDSVVFVYVQEMQYASGTDHSVERKQQSLPM